MRYKLLTFSLVFTIIFSLPGFGNVVSAQTTTTSPGLLPTSPFYFLKDWARGLQSFFTFNSVAKARLELKFSNERATEIKALEEEEETAGVKKALENYEKNMERLKSRLEFLRETSANPNVDELLNELAERTVQHQQLFEELKTKFSDLETKIETVQQKIDESLGSGLENLDLPEKVEIRLETVFDKIDRPLSEVEGLTLISRLENKITKEEIKDKLLKLEEKLVSKFEGKIEAGEIALPQLSDLIKQMSPAGKIKIEFLDTLREEVFNTNIKNQLNVIRQNLLTEIETSGVIKSEEAAEEIEDAIKELSELETLLAGQTGTVANAVRQLLEQAKFNLEQAQRSFEAGDFGRAFGQATSAKAIAKNALRQLKKTVEDVDEEIQEMKEDFDELKAEAAAKGLTPENSVALYKLFNKAESKIVELLSSKSITLAKEVRMMLASIKSIIEVAKELDEDFDIDIRDELKELDKLEDELNGGENDNKTNMREQQEWKVEIKESRFNPPTLKIKKGDKVIWTNIDGSAAWPASAVHPTHTVYPGSSIEKCNTAEASTIFDACKSLAKGESWSFVFNEVGTWKYHNHVLGGATGVVEVED